MLMHMVRMEIIILISIKGKYKSIVNNLKTINNKTESNIKRFLIRSYLLKMIVQL